MVLLVLGSGCDAFDESLLVPPATDLPRALDAGPQDAARTPIDGRVPPKFDSGIADVGRDAKAIGAPGLDAGDAGDEDAGEDGPSEPKDAGHDAGPTDCEPTSVDSYCEHIPALPAAPSIDGKLDCGPELLTLEPKAWNGTGSVPADHSTRIAAAWRPNGLYVYVEVKDPTLTPHGAGDALNCGDAVEIYVDADGSVDGPYSKPGTMQFIVGAPSETSPGTIEVYRYVEGAERSWSSPMVKTAVLADGYAVEVFITAADLDLAAWEPTTRIGLDIAIGVSGTANLRCGKQLGQYFMRVGAAGGDCDGRPWCDSLAFCTPALDPGM